MRNIALMLIYKYVLVCTRQWPGGTLLPDGSSLLRSHLPNPYKPRSVPRQRRWRDVDDHGWLEPQDSTQSTAHTEGE